MKWFITAIGVLLMALVADRSTNLGLEFGYYGELNKLTAAFKSLPDVSVESVGYNPDLTLEEIWFRIKHSQVPRYIPIAEDDPIRELSGEQLKTALARGLAAIANYPKDPRLLQRPVVTKPACDFYPRNYWGWGPDVLGFAISLEEGLRDNSGEAERLARKHGFAYEFRGRKGRHYLAVAWLEPEQVAALRCEDSVLGIGFLLPTIDMSLPAVSPGNSLQPPQA
jgi:hypothetical protein